ncbi:MAG: lipoate--protein ligase family protein [Actinobacteria bacterium]|nr:lipoate--protein ligase family protein [Actinomycetota bacterium]
MKNNFTKIKNIRVLDFGSTDYLDSQAIYHAVAHSFEESSPETLLLLSPLQTYVCIGYFQELEKEVDIEFCKKNGIPILRREVGGGAVLLDNDQLFFQFIFNKNKITKDVYKIYQQFLTPPVNTYRRLGLDVYHRPINDLQLEGRKIGGTGAVEIGLSTVIVGSFMFDFNYELMAKILKVSSEKFRDKIYQNIRDYVTNIKKEFLKLKKVPPSRDRVKEIFLEEVNNYFNAELEFKEKLQAHEINKLIGIRKKLTDKKWLLKKGKFLDRKIKITSDVSICEGSYKSKGGLVRIALSKQNDRILDIDISGDFTMIPSDSLDLIQKEIKSLKLDYHLIQSQIEKVYKRHNIQSPGLLPSDFATALKNIMEKF